MKIYKYLTRISIASCMLFGVSIFQGCMEDSLNDPTGKVSEEEIGRDGFAANAFFLTLCDYAYPIATENIYNTNESLIGDCYGRYQVMATDKFKNSNFATYNAPEAWLNYQFGRALNRSAIHSLSLLICARISRIRRSRSGTAFRCRNANNRGNLSGIVLRKNCARGSIDLIGSRPQGRAQQQLAFLCHLNDPASAELAGHYHIVWSMQCRVKNWISSGIILKPKPGLWLTVSRCSPVFTTQRYSSMKIWAVR